MDIKYPYTDFHELNLDWFLQQFKEQMDAYAQLAADNAEFKQSMEESFNTLDGTVTEFTNFVTNYFDNLDVQNEINNKLNAMYDDGSLKALVEPIFDQYMAITSASLNGEIAARIAADNTINARIDNIIALPSGSTQGDAELMDIRVAANGETYPSAGDAVRGQVDNLTTDIDYISEVVNLFHIDDSTLEGVSLQNTSNGIVLNGTKDGNSSFVVCTLPAGTYTASFVKIGGTSSQISTVSLRYLNGNTTSRWCNENNTEVTMIFEAPTEIYLHIANTNTVTNYGLQIQITEGNSAGDFYPYPLSAVDAVARKSINNILTETQWYGKKWYAYGTSITNINNEGKYPTYLAQMSGMILTNKGKSGGGIGNLGAYSHGQVYDAICNITDGKLEADLITLETAANDIDVDVPLGTIWDTGTSTLAGCLNDCLAYLQENTDAQIVVLPSPAYKGGSDAVYQKYEQWIMMIEQICMINRVHFIKTDANMGRAKLTSTKGSLYLNGDSTGIHQSDLGGFIMAQNIWDKLKNIPNFYTSIPS